MATQSATQAFGFGTPFQAQIDYLRNKLNLPTERWDEITRSAHDRAFVVAGAAKADLLADLHQAVTKAATDGAGLQAFRKDFKSIVAKHGWTGWTGEGSREGEAWRTRVIYQTNMATSYAAGRHAQMSDPEVLKLHPYWRYIHSDGALNPREEHLAWHGVTLLASHPFWKTHWAPNGFGCQCRITSVTRREGEASERAGLGEPPPGWDAINTATGEQQGIGKGFGYTPGASLNEELSDMVKAKARKLPEPLATSLLSDSARVLGSVPKSIDEFIRAGRAITETLPATDAGASHAALLTLLAKEVGISMSAKVASTGGGSKLVRSASQLYPDSWTQKTDAMGPLYVRASANARGFHYTANADMTKVRLPGFKTQLNIKSGTGWIEVRSDNMGNAVHEYAHRLQSALPELDQLFQDLHRRRTNGDPLERLKDLVPTSSYKSTEVTRKDGYTSAYQGKEYAHSPKNPALEVMTMAFQSVLGVTQSDRRSLAHFEEVYRKDREMFDFVVGLLRWWKP